MPLLAALEDFAHDHRPHGPLTADGTEPAWNGLPAHRNVPVWGGV